jgi:clan AA aspartic protease (TIGR02281 family)
MKAQIFAFSPIAFGAFLASMAVLVPAPCVCGEVPKRIEVPKQLELTSRRLNARYGSAYANPEAQSAVEGMERQYALDASGGAQAILQRNRAGHYVARGEINGKPVVFLIDTGATHVSLPLPVARRLQLPLGAPRLAKTANGNVRTWRARLDKVDLGGLRVRDVPAVVLPNLSGEEILLGMSYLRHFELVQRGNTLTLRPPE